MSPGMRSALMARVKGKDTLPEREIAQGLAIAWAARVAVFVDGDFWHGWRFPQWQNKVSEAWELKIAVNRARDRRNHWKLQRMGWKVIRIWEHQVCQDLPDAMGRIVAVLEASQSREREA